MKCLICWRWCDEGRCPGWETISGAQAGEVLTIWVSTCVLMGASEKKNPHTVSVISQSILDQWSACGLKFQFSELTASSVAFWAFGFNMIYSLSHNSPWIWNPLLQKVLPPLLYSAGDDIPTLLCRNLIELNIVFLHFLFLVLLDIFNFFLLHPSDLHLRLTEPLINYKNSRAAR